MSDELIPTLDSIYKLTENINVFNEVVTSSDGTTENTDSEGQNKLTLSGLESLYYEAISKLGGIYLAQWSSGITFTSYNQYATYNGSTYKVKSTTTLPYTTTTDSPLDDTDNVQPFDIKDHSSLINRDEDDAHPASSISTDELPNLGLLESTVQVVLSQLGDSALRTIQESIDDDTEGRAPIKGAWGVGSNVMPSRTDCDDVFDDPNGFYSVVSPHSGGPTGVLGSIIHNMPNLTGEGGSGRIRQVLYASRNASNEVIHSVFTRVKTITYDVSTSEYTETVTDWVEVLTDDSVDSRIFEGTYPVGTIYTNQVNPDNPSTYLVGGGNSTWEAIEGRVVVGIGTGTDSDGESMTFSEGSEGGYYKQSNTIGSDSGSSITTTNHTSSNVQPYVTAYMWVRTG